MFNVNTSFITPIGLSTFEEYQPQDSLIFLNHYNQWLPATVYSSNYPCEMLTITLLNPLIINDYDLEREEDWKELIKESIFNYTLPRRKNLLSNEYPLYQGDMFMNITCSTNQLFPIDRCGSISVISTDMLKVGYVLLNSYSIPWLVYNLDYTSPQMGWTLYTSSPNYFTLANTIYTCTSSY